MRKIILFSNKKDCCACGACLNICPKQAISMKEDQYGFKYPMIDEIRCIGCGLCTKICGYQNSELGNFPKEAYAAQTKNTDIKESASGGVFASIAIEVLKQGGIVYGATLELVDGKLIPHHIGVSCIEDLIKLQGSKYVQSDTEKVYSDVKDKLLENKKVLFSGTPCQVDGLRAYLKKDYSNLYCIDIICHGVPSSKFFNDYIVALSKKYNDKIVDFKFRDKTNGWGLTACAYTANYGKKFIPYYQSSYYEMFLKSYIYRIGCYSCKYANNHRVGDITVGDYWGIEYEHPNFLLSNGGHINEKYGVSCIIVNNPKGTSLLNEYGAELIMLPSTFDKIAAHNNQLIKPCSLDKGKRDRILNSYKLCGYSGSDKEYKKILGWKIVINYLKIIVPKSIKGKIRKILKL